MSSCTFVQMDTSVNLYFAQISEGDTSHKVMFLPKTTKSGSFTLQEAWDDGGCFIFLAEDLWNIPGLHDYLANTLDVITNGYKILWGNKNGQSAISDWTYHSIQVSDQSENTATVSKASNFFCRNYGLNIQKDSILNFNSDSNQFTISNKEGATTIQFSADSGSSFIDKIEGSITIPLYNQTNYGKLQFQLTIAGGSTSLSDMDVGLRYFSNNSETVGNIDSYHYPVFNHKSGSLNLFGLLNILGTEEINNLTFDFLNTELAEIPKIPSHYKSTLGYEIHLEPNGDTAESLQPQLILAVKASTTETKETDPYYLVPSGTFNVSTDRPSTATVPDKIMMGLSGIEFASLPDLDQTIRLKFISGSPAYAPNFSTATSQKESSTTERLNDLVTTSWAYFDYDNLTYYAQPNDAILHAQSETDSTFLNAIDPPAGDLPSIQESSDVDLHKYPAVPYGGVADEVLDDVHQFELKILSPERRQKIYNLNKTTETTTQESTKKTTAATPSGLMASLSEDLKSWKEMTLGKDNAQNVLKLNNVTGTLKAALQTNNQFVVISDPTYLQEVFTQNKVNISGWNFNLDPDYWDLHGTVMILKYYNNKSVEELINHMGTWAHADEFNKNQSTLVQSNIVDIISAASSSDSSYFENFKNVVQDTKWNGILFLNAYVPLNELPAQLEGIAAGIDPSHFYAHHLGMKMSPVKYSATGSMELHQTAFFGLIDYTASADESAVLPTGDYGFEVDTLKVLFENSQIKQFDSQISVTLNRLFGEAATKNGDSGNNDITLLGTYQNKNGQASYTFSCTGDSVFTISSPTLDTVEILSAQFITLQPKYGWSAGSTVNTRFIFQGKLSFKTLNTVDLFSYKKLPFSGLWLDMNFNISSPTTSRAFTFDTSSLKLNTQKLTFHEGNTGFAKQFPLKLKKLVYNADGSGSVGSDYANVTMPGNFSGLGGGFYGLVYDLDLGSMGGLAPKKSFTAQIMVCWAPQTNYTAPEKPEDATYPALMKMKLPFSSDGKDMLDIQGVIKLGIDSIQLSAADDAYTIKLRNFGLHVLSITIPPSGSTDIYLFGNPGSGTSSLGWYAAYSKDVSYAQDPYST